MQPSNAAVAAAILNDDGNRGTRLFVVHQRGFRPKIDLRKTWQLDFTQQLRAAEDRIAQLEADQDTYRQKAERAEQWLHAVYTEIEDRFLKQDAPRRARR